MKRFQKNLLIFTLLCFVFKYTECQKVITLANTTTLKSYTTSTSFEHLSFDTPLKERGKLVDYDASNVYILAKKSFSELKTYYFKKISMSTLTTTSTTLEISNYQLAGMCQHEGTLDYFIGFNTETEEIQVCTIDTSMSPNIPLYCKSVPYTLPLEQDYIYADCKYVDTKNDMNRYIIGIGASSLDPIVTGQYNYFYAKFNTYYNFTESVYESSDPDVSERLVDIKVDTVHNQIYVALDINSNVYRGATIFRPGDERTDNNPNIAIVAYDFNNAVVNWIKIVGDHNYIDYFADMEVNGNHLVLVTNSYTMNFTTSVPSKDILMYKFRYETGVIEGQLVFGSSVDDIAYDLIVSYQGMYLLASFGDNFWPHPTTGAVWGTPNDEIAFGLIWINNEFSLVDIEGYRQSIMSTIPLRAFPSIKSTYFTQFTFISPASVVQTHGALFTQFSDATLLYSSFSCNLECPYCNRYTADTDCMSCDTESGKYLSSGTCDTSCPDYTYLVSGTYICAPCDYSCKTWAGPKDDQCITCCTGGDCGTSLLDKVSNFGKCECETGSYESHGKCLEKWVNGLYARLDKQWYEYWPRNTYPKIPEITDVADSEITHYDDSDYSNWVVYDHVLQFNSSGNGIAVPGPPGMSAFPTEFTLSFWFRATTFNTNTNLINLFDRVFINVQSMKIHFVFERGSSDLIEPTYTGILNTVSYNTWVYVGVSQKEQKDSGIHQISQRIVIGNGRSMEPIEAGTKDDHSAGSYSKFNNEIFIGGYSYSTSQSFSGIIKEVKLFTKFHDSAQMIVDNGRIHEIYSFNDPYLIAYWKLSESYYSTDAVQKIKDYSISNIDGTQEVEFSPIINPKYPSFKYNTTVGLNLCFYNDVAVCKGLKNLPQIFSRSWRIENEDNFKLESWTHTIIPNDQILFNSGGCETGTTLAVLTRINGDVWEADSSLPPRDLEDGKHYDV